VGGQVVAGVVGRGEDRDAEALVQRARAVGPVGEPLGDLVIDDVCGLGRRTHGDAEDLGELRLEPEPDRRPAVRGPVRAQQPPCGARVLLGQRTLADPERIDRDARRVQHPGDVVVRRDEQRCRVAERGVGEQDPGIDVPVRGDDRQLPHRVVEPPRDGADARIGGEESVGVQAQGGGA
jgi:hypothetical protein